MPSRKTPSPRHVPVYNLVLPEDLDDEVRKRAAEERRTLRSIIVEALRRGLEAE